MRKHNKIGNKHTLRQIIFSVIPILLFITLAVVTILKFQQLQYEKSIKQEWIIKKTEDQRWKIPNPTFEHAAQKQLPTPSPTPFLEPTGIPEEDYLIALQKELGTHAKIASSSSQIWTNHQNKYEFLHGYYVNLDGSNFSTSEKKFNTRFEEEYVASGYYNAKTKTVVLFRLLDASDHFFTDKGFRIDPGNSASSSAESIKLENFSISHGYEKEGMKCIANVNTSFTFAFFFCGIPDIKQNKLVEEFTHVINPQNLPNKVISVEKVVGDFAVGSEHEIPGGGSIWFAKKINGSWQKIASTQNGLSCDLVNKYQIPKGITSSCW